MFSLTLLFLIVGSSIPGFSSAFQPTIHAHEKVSASFSRLDASRRSFLAEATTTATVFTALIDSGPQPAFASGGATAGGAYLLSAKQRYNERVKSGVTGFLALESALKNSNLDPLRAYFSSEDVGGWKDFSSAGYLLANAFRTNSSKAPDALPSVKAWKKYAADVDNMTKSLKKKDMSEALAAYTSAVSSLDGYLAEVELPPSKDI